MFKRLTEWWQARQRRRQWERLTEGFGRACAAYHLEGWTLQDLHITANNVGDEYYAEGVMEAATMIEANETRG